MERTRTLVFISCLVLLGNESASINPNIEILNRMLSDMDERANPCQNFYNSSRKNLEWGESPTVNAQFKVLFEGLKNQSFKEHSLEEKVRRFYQICLGSSKAPGPIKYFKLVPPGENLPWPHLTPNGSEWPKEKFKWMETLARLRRYGLNDVMFGMNVRLDPDSGHPIVVIERKYNFRFRFLESLLGLGLSHEMVMEIAPLDHALREMYILDKQWEDEGRNSPKRRISLRELEFYGVFLTEYLEIVFGRQFLPDFEVHMENLYYMMRLQELMTAVDNQVVAHYLSARFLFYSMFTLAKSKHGGVNSCVNVMRFCLEFASNLLYEEQVLGRRRFRSYMNQAEKVFEAMRNQLLIRVERNSLNLTIPEINSLQNRLKSLSLSIGNLPGKGGHRRFVTDFYKDLEFEVDEDLETAQLKVLKFRTNIELSLLDNPVAKTRRYVIHSYPISNNFFETAIEENGNTIYLSYDILEDSSFDPDAHDIFKMIPLSIFIGMRMLGSLNIVEKCEQNDVNLLNLFDDNQIITGRYTCANLWEPKWEQNLREEYLLNLNLAYEAYFAEGSKFSQRQPNFTTMSLRELFFLRFGQSTLGNNLYSRSDFVKGGPPINSVTMLPAFVQTFNCLDNGKVFIQKDGI
ncbi:uncharacterized protein LOC119545988 [Drosophila subpulchrella]|uniref:uncharacterized protein LOC119545988 n=1 Tax=Drosophila subpulchrella TaxID=1486046 RepID=UPI0018A176F1|nr:uncharacterized protein LOC119545988 [Drosophila subpulchrella]